MNFLKVYVYVCAHKCVFAETISNEQRNGYESVGHIGDVEDGAWKFCRI